MAVSNIQLYGTGFTTVNDDINGTGDVYAYELDFQNGAVDKIVISGNWGSKVAEDGPNSSGLDFFLAPPIGFLKVLPNAGFEYTLTLEQAVLYNSQLGPTLQATAGGRQFGDTAPVPDFDTILGNIVNLCFGEGTMIATPEGEKAVETLEIGDIVTTAEGKDVAVKWMGRQTISTVFGGSERRMPVSIAAGALGENLPKNDLVVTADHAILVDGVLCHAGALVNGATIKRVPLSDMGGESFVVYHIETELHELVLAEGVEAETLIDNTTRQSFDNYAEYLELFGETAEMVELAYPRAMSARQLPASVRARLGIDAAA